MHSTSSITPVERELSLLGSHHTGIVLGILLTLQWLFWKRRSGWSFNMSIIALLIGYGIWHLARPWPGVPLNTCRGPCTRAISAQTCGLCRGVDHFQRAGRASRFMLLTGNQLAALPMIAWVFSVSFLGIWIAWYLRRFIAQ